MRGIGSTSSKICFIVDRPSVSATAEGAPLTGVSLSIFNEKVLTAGIHPEDVRIECLSTSSKAPTPSDRERLKKIVSECNATVLVPMGEDALRFTTGKSNLEKWVLSPLETGEAIAPAWAVPSFSPSRLNTQPEYWVYFIRALLKAKEIAEKGFWQYPEERFLLNPTIGECLDVLRSLRDKEYLSIDVETGRGQINTLGFAWSPEDAIAIQVLPSRCSAPLYKELWEEACALLESDQKKILQNAMYEKQVFAQYGIALTGVWHDTMVGQKFLWPEFKAGLGNVGRFYTRRSYWKDDGKVSSEEEGKKDWGNIRDWRRHFLYNCRDTAGTYEACFGQRRDLQDRGSAELFDNYIMRLFGPAAEMCLRGFPVDECRREGVERELVAEIEEVTGEFPKGFNPASPKQKLAFLKEKGYQIPKAKNNKGKYQESTNELSLKKLKLKYPEDQDLDKLIRFSKLNKALGSYVRVGYHWDKRLRFSLNIFGTETGRWSSKKDFSGRGFNAQTVNKKYARFLVAPPGHTWLEIDLQKAESFFVAYDSCEETLIKMLSNGEDIHKYVAAEIYQKPQSEVTKAERQLGKKSGHGANYSMGPVTFQETCLKEEDLYLTRAEAKNALEAYHRAFPGIRRWQQEIEIEVRRKRYLRNPLGLERYFYGRMNNQLLREALAYKPQSTIPAVMNHLMLHLWDLRTEGAVDFTMHLQKHDSLLLAVRPDNLEKIVTFARDYEKWHPEVILPAGKLTIPVSCETGENLGELKEYGN